MAEVPVEHLCLTYGSTTMLDTTLLQHVGHGLTASASHPEQVRVWP